MRAGRLNSRIIIQNAVLASADTYGDQAEAWSDIAEVWAEVRQLGAVENWKQKAASPEATVQVTLRYNADLTAQSRFRFGTRYLYPLSVVTDIKSTQHVCLCKEQL